MNRLLSHSAYARSAGKLCALVFIMFASFSLSAQGVLSNTPTQTGTIQVEAQDDGYITISGRNYGYLDGVSLVYLNGEQVPSESLGEGVVVRFTVNGDGVLTRLELLGPAALLPVPNDN